MRQYSLLRFICRFDAIEENSPPMSWDFLRKNGGQRMREQSSQPDLLMGRPKSRGGDPDESVLLDYETAPDLWQPRDTDACRVPEDWPWKPLRFVDGKDVGRIVAWLQTPEGYPVPIRLAQIGGIALRNEDRALRREWSRAERGLAMMTHFFDEAQVEQFEATLAQEKIQLLKVPPPAPGDAQSDAFDFERARETTQRRTAYTMERLEREAVKFGGETPALVDGRIDKHAGAFDPQTTPIVGMIKSHYKRYLDPYPPCWKTFYNLAPGERTPAFAIEDLHVGVVSWYLRLCGASGEMPNWGVIRLEVPRVWFEEVASQDWECLDYFSRLVCHYRCRDEGYGRAPVSLAPIQRAEEMLGALFTRPETLAHRFYHLSGL